MNYSLKIHPNESFTWFSKLCLSFLETMDQLLEPLLVEYT